MVRYTELSRPVQKFRALIGNPRPSQQLMGQLPICCCSKAKKFNDFSRAGVGVCVSGKGGRASVGSRVPLRSPVIWFWYHTRGHPTDRQSGTIARTDRFAQRNCCRLRVATGQQSCSSVVRIRTSGIPCASPNSHRPVQKLRALIGNPRPSQQLMGQLPICCCSKAKKFNDFSRAGVGVCVSGKGGFALPARQCNVRRQQHRR